MKVLKNILAVITFVVMFVSTGYMYMQIKSFQQIIDRMEAINNENGIRGTYEKIRPFTVNHEDKLAANVHK